MGPLKPGWAEADVEAVIARGDPAQLLYVPVVVGLSASPTDRLWAESICMQLSAHSDPAVRSNAILGFGHIARNCRDLSLDAVLPVVVDALDDHAQPVRDHARNALVEIQTAMPQVRLARIK